MQHSSPFRMKLKARHRLTDPKCQDTVMQITLAPVAGESLRDFSHGQCMRIGIPRTRRPAPAYFAIASSPEEEDGYDFIVKQTGGMADYLCRMEKGGEVELDGPMGKGFDISRMRGRNVILVGVGTGIAPLRSVWRSIVRHRNDFGNVSIHAGFLTSLHCLMMEETDALHEHDIDVYTTLTHQDEGWNGPIGYVQKSLERVAPSPENAIVCLAGMTAMIEGCTEVLSGLGFDNDQILLNF